MSAAHRFAGQAGQALPVLHKQNQNTAFSALSGRTRPPTAALERSRRQAPDQVSRGRRTEASAMAAAV